MCLFFYVKIIEKTVCYGASVESAFSEIYEKKKLKFDMDNDLKDVRIQKSPKFS